MGTGAECCEWTYNKKLDAEGRCKGRQSSEPEEEEVVLPEGGSMDGEEEDEE